MKEKNTTFKIILKSFNKHLSIIQGGKSSTRICVYRSKCMLCKDYIMVRTSRCCKNKTNQEAPDRY